MWVFTIYGFYSIACANTLQKPFKIDADRLMVRARQRQHLENLRARFVEELEDFSIATSVGTDYRYRIVVPKIVWIEMLAEMGEEQKFSNFKNEVAKNVSHHESGFVESLHRVWSIMYGLQPAGSPQNGFASLQGENTMSSLVASWTATTRASYGITHRKVSATQQSLLEEFGMMCGNDAVPIMEWCVENWNHFVRTMKMCQNLKSAPAHPSIAFMNKYRTHAYSMYLDSLPTPK